MASDADAIFYFDLACPYSYIASKRIEAVARFTQSRIRWVPVFLPELEARPEPEDKDGKPIEWISDAHKKVVATDFERETRRYGLKISPHPQHPLRTVDAGRLLCAFPDEYRPQLAIALFHAYWAEHSNISNQAVLLRIARNLGLRATLPFPIDANVFSDVSLHDRFAANNEEARAHGAFSTPSFYVPERKRFFWGQDRLPLLEVELASIRLGKPIERIPHLERLLPRCLRTPPEARARTCYLWGDFSSPYTALAVTQLERLRRDSGESVTIVFKPFHLGSLLKQVGAPLIPMQTRSPARQAYDRQDIADWTRFWNAVNQQEYPPIETFPLRWPDEFPVRSALALRVVILEPRALMPIFRAAWVDNIRIGDPDALAKVLNAADLPGASLVRDAAVDSTERGKAARATLRANTEEAVQLGLCGAPTWQLGRHTVWGQDRINMVQDLIAGWRPESSSLLATVAAFPHFDYRL